MRDPYSKLGDSAARLIGSFMDGGQNQKGYEDESRKISRRNVNSSRANLNNEKALGQQLENEKQRRGLSITADKLIRAMGVDNPERARMEAPDSFEGPRSVSPQDIDKTQRGDSVFLGQQLGGGNVEAIVRAISGMQDINARDNVLNGSYDAEQVAESAAAADGDPLFQQGINGIMQKFTGELQGTDLSAARANNYNASANKRNKDIKAGTSLIKKQASPRDNYNRLVNNYIPRASNGFAPDQEAIDYGENVINDVMTQQYGVNWKSLINPKNKSTPAAQDLPPGIPQGWTVEQVIQ